MNVFKQIILILSLFCIAMPARAMDSDDGNQGFFGRIWDAAKEHPVLTGAIAAGTVVGLWVYRASSLNNQLFDAIGRNAVDEVRLLIKKGAHIHAKDNHGVMPLPHAVDRGYLEIVKLLLEAGADANATMYGKPALHNAASNGRLEVVKLLLNAGADIKAKNSLCSVGETLLHSAAEGGNIEIITLFLESCAGMIDLRDSYGFTPLYYATRCGHVEAVKFLLEAGADITSISNSGYTLLHGAAGHGRVEVVKLLLEKGADVNAKGSNNETPLFLASLKGYNAVIRLLLDAGADIRIADNDNLTPLHVGLGGGHIEKVQLLLQRAHHITSINDRSESSARIKTALCLFKRVGLPRDVQKEILSYLAEDVITKEHARILFWHHANLRQLVAACPLAWFIDIYHKIDDTDKSDFLEAIIFAIVQHRLSSLQELLEDMQNVLGFSFFDPTIMSTMLDPNNVEQHRAAIAANVRAAFVGQATEVSKDINNNNNE